MISDRDLNKYFGHLEDYKYRHYNRALGRFVEGKEHFKYLLALGDYIPFDKAQEIIKKESRKEYKLSKEAEKFIKELKGMADKKGNIRLGGRAIEKMKELGVNFDRFIPTVNTKGGFGNAS